MTLQGLVRQGRQRAGLTQQVLADRAGVAQPVVARAESSSSNPSVRTIERLLAAAGATVVLGPPAPDPHDLALLDAALRLSVEERLDRLLTLTSFAEELRDAAGA